jgi:O-antigen/teichoic acid export membrane protein
VLDSLAVAGSQYLTRGMVVARGIVAAAVLTPRGYGAWNALNLIFDYGTYAGAGAIQGLDLRLPAAVDRGEAALAQRLQAGAWLAVCLGGLLFALLVAGYVAAGGRAFSGAGGGELPFLMLAAALLQLAYQYGGSALRAHGRIRPASAANAVQSVAGGGLGIALVWRFGIHGLLGGWIAGSLVGLAVLVAGARGVPWRPRGPATGLALVRAGAPMFGFFAATLVLRSVDRIALVRFGTPEALGLYGIGLMAASTVLHLPEAVAYVLLPRLASAAGGGRDVARTRAETLRAQRALALLLPPVVAVAATWAEPLVARLLPDYLPGLPALRVLALAAAALSLATLPAYALLAEGRNAQVLWLGCGGAALTAALTFGTAARMPEPLPVAIAAACGFVAFAAAMVWENAARWLATPAERVRLLAATWLPWMWGAGLLALVSPHGGPTAAGALVRTAAILAGFAPAWLAFGRGLGLAGLLRGERGRSGGPPGGSGPGSAGGRTAGG